MSAPLAPNLDAARAHMFAQLNEAFPNVGGNRHLRLRLLADVTGHPIETTRTFTERQYRWTARRLREYAEDPERAKAVLRKVAAELAPPVEQVAAAPQIVTEANDNRGRALAALEDIGESDHFNRWRAGDAGNILLADAPEARPRDVLSEYLKLPETQKLKTFLCPKLAYASKLPAEVQLKLETSTVETWWKVCRVAARVPTGLRERYEILSWTWFETAAITPQPRDGRKVPPTVEDIERRLQVAADNEYHFRSPQDLRRWVAVGEVMTDRPAAEKPDLTDAALAAFRAAFYDCDSVVSAWDRVFGAGGQFGIRGRAK